MAVMMMKVMIMMINGSIKDGTTAVVSNNCGTGTALNLGWDNVVLDECGDVTRNAGMVSNNCPPLIRVWLAIIALRIQLFNLGCNKKCGYG